MTSERITLATDPREQPINFTEMLWSSESTRWSGFRLEKHHIGPRGRLHDFGVPDILLGVCVSGSAQMQYTRRGETRRAVVRTGNFTLLNVGEQQRSIEWSGIRETLYIRVETAQLERYLPERAGGRRIEVTPQYGVIDPHVVRLVACIYDEANSGCATGQVYAESLSLALATYLLKRFSPGSEREHVGASNAFTHVVSSRIVDYIRANLGHDVALTELAEIADLSPHYFMQIFKNTFGMTPHRYLLNERIKEAKHRLRHDHGSISEIGLDLGFADQSHFTRTFRSLTGTTPRRFKKQGDDGLRAV